MNIDDLVRDIQRVRRSGLGLRVAEVPALREALERRWPDGLNIEHRLEDLIIEAASKLDEQASMGIRLALGVGTLGGTSKDRRAAFATHYGRLSTETVRRPRSGRPSLEEEAFTALARAILTLPGVTHEPESSELSPTLRLPAQGGPATATVLTPEAVVRVQAMEAERSGLWEHAATWAVLLLAAIKTGDHADPVDNEAKLAEQYLQTGLSCFIAGRVAEAQDYLLQGERSSQLILDLSPNDADAEARLALTLLMLSSIQLQSGDVARARDLGGRASDLLHRAAEKSPPDPENRSLIAFGLLQSGSLRLVDGDAEQAEGMISQGVNLLQELVSDEPHDLGYQGLLASGLVQLGAVHIHADRESEAEDLFNRAVELNRPLAGQPTAGGAMASLIAFAPMVDAQAHFYLGMIYGMTERLPSAEVSLTRSVELLEELASNQASPPALVSTGVGGMYPFALMLLGFVYVEQGQGSDAASALQRAADQLDETDADSQAMLADVLETLAQIHQDAGRVELAEDLRLREQRIRMQLAAQDPTDG